MDVHLDVIQCAGCGWCCKTGVVPIDSDDELGGAAGRLARATLKVDGSLLRDHHIHFCPFYEPNLGRCVIYDDRPRACRQFTLGSAECLEAREVKGFA